MNYLLRTTFLLLMTLLLTACSHSQSTSTEITFLDGQTVTLEELTEGKPALINFWASWCSFCKDELPLLQSVAEQTPIQVIGINLQEDSAAANAYWKQGGYTFHALLDPSSVLKQQFGVFTQPTTVLLDPKGAILDRKDGVFTEAELDQFVENLMATVDPTTITEPISDEVLPIAFNAMTSPVTQLLSQWYQDEVEHLIPLNEILSGGPPKDGIPSIDDPKFTPVAEADYLTDDSLGLLVKIGPEARFYPFAILNWHEIVNDTVAGLPIAVTYCPLCATAVVYERTVLGQITEFGVSGFLYQSNLLMYDRLTESLWDQVKGQAVVGSLTGNKVKMVPSDVVKFSTVRDSLPNAQILSTETGVSRDYNRDPYQGYADSPQLYFPSGTTDTRLPVKELTYGIVVGGQAKAYALKDLQVNSRIQDQVGEVPVLVQYEAATGRVRFSKFDKETQQEVGTVDPIYGFWFSWAAKYPKTEVYGP